MDQIPKDFRQAKKSKGKSKKKAKAKAKKKSSTGFADGKILLSSLS